MTTAIIGVGNIGGALARHLVDGGEPVMLAAREESNAAALAGELGPLASAATVQEAIAAADVVVVAVWFDALKQVDSPRSVAALSRRFPPVAPSFDDRTAQASENA